MLFKEKRKEIMNAIASDSMMSQEMIGVMMNSKNGMMMQGNDDRQSEFNDEYAER